MTDVLMTGHRLHSWGGDLRWERLERPQPDPGEVLIAVEACGVGLTTLNSIRGDLADNDETLPLVPGHELVGRVIEAPEATDQHLVGRRVAAYFYLSCGVCRWCLAGWDQRCDDLAGLVGVHRDGGYAPFATLPSRNAIVIPDEIDAVTSTLIPDAVATPLHICGERARLGPTDRTVVIGAGGGIGAHLVQVACLYGSEVLAVDTNEDKLQALEGLGIRSMSGNDLHGAEPAGLFDGGRPTVVIDMVGTDLTLAWSHDSVDTGGRFIVVTTFRDRTFPTDPRSLVFREAAVIASRYARRSEVADAATLVARGDIQPVIGGVEPAANVEQLHELLRGGELLGRGAIDWTRDSDQDPEASLA